MSSTKRKSGSPRSSVITAKLDGAFNTPRLPLRRLFSEMDKDLVAPPNTPSSPAQKKIRTAIKMESLTPKETYRAQPSKAEYCQSSSSASSSASEGFCSNENSPRDPAVAVVSLSNKRIFEFSDQQEKRRNVFCYSCKRYGHKRQNCNSKWYHWWPQEYISEYGWLKMRVRDANVLRRKGRMTAYHLATRRIEDDVENADIKRQQNGDNFFAHRGSLPQSRVDGQRILSALRRITPPPPKPAQYSFVPPNQYYRFRFQKKIEELEQQIEELRLELTATNCKSSSGSVPTSSWYQPCSNPRRK